MKNILIIIFISIYTIGYSQYRPISMHGRIINSDKVLIEIYSEGLLRGEVFNNSQYSIQLEENTSYNIKFIDLKSDSTIARLVHLKTGKVDENSEIDLDINYVLDYHYSLEWDIKNRRYWWDQFKTEEMTEEYIKFLQSPPYK